MTTHYLTSRWQRMRGALGRDRPGDVFVFRYDDRAHRLIHTLGMRHPVQVEFLVDGRTAHRTTLAPWRGFAHSECTTIRETILE
jgi:hypothetical protein